MHPKSSFYPHSIFDSSYNGGAFNGVCVVVEKCKRFRGVSFVLADPTHEKQGERKIGTHSRDRVSFFLRPGKCSVLFTSCCDSWSHVPCIESRTQPFRPPYSYILLTKQQTDRPSVHLSGNLSFNGLSSCCTSVASLVGNATIVSTLFWKSPTRPKRFRHILHTFP